MLKEGDSPDGAVEGVAAVLRDVTARWEKDRELRRRLRDLEGHTGGAGGAGSGD
jgi:hypothetical protein